MSLTNMRRVPGSSTSNIIRAASPPTSGIDANSLNRTRTTPSDVGIGAGNGSVGAWAATTDISSSAMRSVREVRMRALIPLERMAAHHFVVPRKADTRFVRRDREAVGNLQRRGEQWIYPVNILQPVGRRGHRQQLRTDFRVEMRGHR